VDDDFVVDIVWGIVLLISLLGKNCCLLRYFLGSFYGSMQFLAHYYRIIEIWEFAEEFLRFKTNLINI